MLTNKLYNVSIGFNHGFIFLITIARIANVLKQPHIQITVCTNSKFLYNYLIKLGNTTKKKLIINIMSLRESYEAREIIKICWINGRDNPANAIIKKIPTMYSPS